MANKKLSPLKIVYKTTGRKKEEINLYDLAPGVILKARLDCPHRHIGLWMRTDCGIFDLEEFIEYDFESVELKDIELATKAVLEVEFES